MIYFKLNALALSLVVSGSAFNAASKPFYGQTIKNLITTQDKENITNTFVDAKNTLWISTKDDIYYKTQGSNEFKLLILSSSFLQKNPAANQKPFTVFVKTNYSNSSTFYIYQSGFGLDSCAGRILIISYDKSTPVASINDFSYKLKNITAMWADDRGVLVAASDLSNTPTIYAASASDLSDLNKMSSQPNPAVYANKRLSTALFRSKSDTPLQNMIIVASSPVNPYAANITFDSTYGTILAGTDLAGNTFNNYIDTTPTIGTANVFSNVIVSTYSDYGTPAYILTGASAADYSTFKTTYSLDIFLDPQNRQTFSFSSSWKNNVQLSMQTKNMAPAGSYVFFSGKNPFSSYYYPYIYSYQITTPNYAIQPQSVDDEKFLNINETAFQANVKDLQDNLSDADSYYYLPSFASDTDGTLYIGVGSYVMYLSENQSKNDSSSKLMGIVFGIVGAVVAAGLLSTAGIWYYLKKRK